MCGQEQDLTRSYVVVPLACPAERTTTVNSGAIPPTREPHRIAYAHVRDGLAAETPSLPKLRCRRVDAEEAVGFHPW